MEVAEVENLFLTEELLEVVNDIMGFSDNSRIEDVKKYIIENRFSEEINKQIWEAIVSEIKFKLTTVAISKENEEKANETFYKILSEIYENVKKGQECKFKQVFDSKIYKEVLKVFNCKSLSTSTGHFFELNNKAYRDFVIRQIKGKRAKDIIAAIIPYLPKEIPIK